MRTAQQRGLTLIELVITLSVLAILINLGLPNLQQMFIKAQVDADTERISQTLRYARAYAINHNIEITTCFTFDLFRCDRRANKAIIIFNDMNQNRKVDSGELIEKALLKGGNPMILFNMSVGRHYLRYRPNGTVKEFGHITYCPARDKVIYARRLIVSRMGRAREAHDEDADGIVNAPDGSNISC